MTASAADKAHKVCTMIHDLRETGDALWDRFPGGREGTPWYPQGVVEALRKGWEYPVLRLLSDAVDHLHEAAGRRT